MPGNPPHFSLDYKKKKKYNRHLKRKWVCHRPFNRKYTQRHSILSPCVLIDTMTSMGKLCHEKKSCQMHLSHTGLINIQDVIRRAKLLSKIFVF